MTAPIVHRPPTPEQLRRLERERERCTDPEFSAVLREYRQAVQSDPVPVAPAYMTEGE